MADYTDVAIRVFADRVLSYVPVVGDQPAQNSNDIVAFPALAAALPVIGAITPTPEDISITQELECEIENATSINHIVVWADYGSVGGEKIFENGVFTPTYIDSESAEVGAAVTLTIRRTPCWAADSFTLYVLATNAGGSNLVTTECSLATSVVPALPTVSPADESTFDRTQRVRVDISLPVGAQRIIVHAAYPDNSVDVVYDGDFTPFYSPRSTLTLAANVWRFDLLYKNAWKLDPTLTFIAVDAMGRELDNAS